MSDLTRGLLLTCGVFCVYPLIAAVTAVVIDRRVRNGQGWRSWLRRNNKDES